MPAHNKQKQSGNAASTSATTFWNERPRPFQAVSKAFAKATSCATEEVAFGASSKAALAILLITGSLQAAAAPLTATPDAIFEGDTSFGRFGLSVDLSGNRALIGAEDADTTNGTASGAVYLYDTDNGQLLRTIAGERQGFGRAVTLSGDRALVSAPFVDTENGVDSGVVYLYDTTTGERLRTFEGLAQDDNLGSTFESLALSGNLALIGAYDADTSNGTLNGLDTGAAYLYNIDTGALLHTFEGQETDDGFGVSVALSGNRALIGARRAETSDQIRRGQAYLYDTETGALLQTFAGGAAQDDLGFGFSVDLSGNRALIGSPYADTANGELSGAAYLYDTETGALLQTFAGFAEKEGMGFSVSLADDLALISAIDPDPNSPVRTGTGYLFNIDGTLLETFATDATEDFFSVPNALTSELALFGAGAADTSSVDSAGAAYLYRLSSAEQGVPAPGTLALAVLGLAATAGRRATRGIRA